MVYKLVMYVGEIIVDGNKCGEIVVDGDRCCDKEVLEADVLQLNKVMYEHGFGHISFGVVSDKVEK